MLASPGYRPPTLDQCPCVAQKVSDQTAGLPLPNLARLPYPPYASPRPTSLAFLHRHTRDGRSRRCVEVLPLRRRTNYRARRKRGRRHRRADAAGFEWRRHPSTPCLLRCDNARVVCPLRPPLHGGIAPSPPLPRVLVLAAFRPHPQKLQMRLVHVQGSRSEPYPLCISRSRWMPRSTSKQKMARSHHPNRPATRQGHAPFNALLYGLH